MKMYFIVVEDEEGNKLPVFAQDLECEDQYQIFTDGHKAEHFRCYMQSLFGNSLCGKRYYKLMEVDV